MSEVFRGVFEDIFADSLADEFTRGASNQERDEEEDVVSQSYEDGRQTLDFDVGWYVKSDGIVESTREGLDRELCTLSKR